MSRTAAAGRPRIVVLDDWERALERLADWSALRARAEVTLHHAPLAGAALVDALREADAAVFVRDRTAVDAALLAQLPRLKCLVFTGSRNTRLDAAAVRERGIALGCTGWGPSKESTCELTWALILAAVRQLPSHTARLRAGQWRAAAPEVLPGVLHGQRLGLVGLGQIGARVAAVGRAFGMEVAAWSPRMTAERAAEHGARFLPLEELLAGSAVVSLHLVPTPATRHLMNRERLALMRPGSVLVNTSRSALVDHAALAEALRAGRPGAAALDVFDEEPLPAGSPLREAPNLLMTPHDGFVCEPVFARFAQDAVTNLAAWLDGRPLPVQPD
ncbi:D-2-hydroxyacid dehydrogenase family protein [Ramlibacter tataouinensis]|nr:D-2-hydroxyacid dehydrogenase family protein [Ramlibacter tataouinensis]